MTPWHLKNNCPSFPLICQKIKCVREDLKNLKFGSKTRSMIVELLYLWKDELIWQKVKNRENNYTYRNFQIQYSCKKFSF